MRRALLLAVVRAVAIVLGGVIGFGAMTLLVPDRLDVEPHSASDTSAGAVPSPSRLDRLMDRHECSHDGFGADGPEPEHAIVRAPSGHLRLLSFARGWQVYIDGGPGTLVAVCLR